jgi:hypothetical protein
LLEEEERTLVTTLGQAASTKLPAYRQQKDLLIGDQDTRALFKTLQATKTSLAAIDFVRTTRTSAFQKRRSKFIEFVGIPTDRQQLNERIRRNETAELNRSVTTRIDLLLEDAEPKLKALQALFERATAAVGRLEVDSDTESPDIHKQYKSVEKLCIGVRSTRDDVRLIDPEEIRNSLAEYNTEPWDEVWKIWRACATTSLFDRLAEVRSLLPEKKASSRS